MKTSHQNAGPESGPTMADLVYQFSHATDDRRRSGIICNATLIAVATIAVVLRFASRRLKGARILWDDYMVVIALVFCYGLAIEAILTLHYGLGRHTAVIGLPNTIKFLLVDFVCSITYCFCNLAVKLSVLMLYHRIFVENHRFKTCLYIVAGASVAFTIGSVCATIFQCSPINLSWDKTITHGSCMDPMFAFCIVASISMVMDVLILVMPMPIVWRLRIPIRQRFAVTGIFMLGSFVCYASAIRIYYIAHVADEHDPSWNAWWPGVWSVVEVDVGVICACLPIMRPLFCRIRLPGALTRPVGNSMRYLLSPSRSSHIKGKESRSSSFGDAGEDKPLPDPLASTMSWPGRRIEAILDEPPSSQEGNDSIPSSNATTPTPPPSRPQSALLFSRPSPLDIPSRRTFGSTLSEELRTKWRCSHPYRASLSTVCEADIGTETRGREETTDKIESPPSVPRKDGGGPLVERWKRRDDVEWGFF